MDRGVELPLATAAVRPTHAEPVCTLTVLHLPENRLDALPALAIEAAARLVRSLRSMRARAVIRFGMRPRGGGASRRAARCLWSFCVAMSSSHSSVSVAAFASDQ